MYNRLDSILACNRQTDGRTDRRTNRQKSCDGIVSAVHTRRAVKRQNGVAKNTKYYDVGLDKKLTLIIKTSKHGTEKNGFVGRGVDFRRCLRDFGCTV